MKPASHIFRDATLMQPDGTCLSGHGMAIGGGRILWTGPTGDMPDALTGEGTITENIQGDLLTPGLVDCHTHLVWGGDRSHEFRQRLEGKTYRQIAEAGGGILSTVRMTREASEEALLEQSLPRILAMRAEGVMTVEIKSGYGLDLTHELKMLRVARKLGKLAGIRVRTTFLGAHAVPPEYAGRQGDYVDYVCETMLPAVAESGLADAVDVFCESIAFTVEETARIFEQSAALGLRVKCHAEQLGMTGAASLAAQFDALSCDHVEYLDDGGMDAMARAGTVAVLLPGAYYFLAETRKPPVEGLRARQIGMAVATDCNPGSSPTTSLRLMMSMACRFFGMRVDEVWAGVTTQAARALGLGKETGALVPGLCAEFIRWKTQDSALPCYFLVIRYHMPFGAMIPGIRMESGASNPCIILDGLIFGEH